MVSVWSDPPKMDVGAPDPHVQEVGESLWLSYRTSRGDHFAVLRFLDVATWVFGAPNDERLDEHPLWTHGLGFYTFHEVQHLDANRLGLRRWVVTFHDDTLDVTARDAELVVRSIQAKDARSALSMVRA
jgi:hypothetical protein